MERPFERGTIHLGELLSMVINHLLAGMILQEDSWNAVPNKYIKYFPQMVLYFIDKSTKDITK